MAITVDYHTHTSFSDDSQAPMEEMVKSAIEKGLTHICFTEHMDIGFPKTPSMPEGSFFLNTDSYLYDLLCNREKYGNQIQILFGVELGLQTQCFREIDTYAKSFPFDFIIGSSHLVRGMDPYEKEYYEGRPEEEAYREYFQSEIDNIAKFSEYDVYGHLDYVVRYGMNRDKEYSYEKYKDLLDKVLEGLLEKGKGLEINTASIRKGLRDVHPYRDVLKRYKQLGGEIITIGSDAHKPEDVGADRKAAEEALLDAGFQYYTIYEKRVPQFMKIK